MEQSSRSRIVTIVTATLISGLVYIISVLHITDPISKAVTYSISPLLSSINRIQIEIRNEISTITQANTLTNKYEALQEQNLVLRSQVAQIGAILDENKKLREQLGAPSLDKFKLVPAKVINRERELTVVYDTTNTVSKGAIVVYKNQFVGKVKSADTRSATLVLATDPQMELPIQIVNEENNLYKGTIKGDFGTGMTAEMIEQSAKIEKGDLVVLAKSPGLPEGVVVGEVREVKKRESELFQQAKVNSYLDFEKLDTVFIIQ
ncbi:MAG: rod shape-determining protein MreC [bacterium]|nr:rod shape-determining protein MreC [bacterium]